MPLIFIFFIILFAVLTLIIFFSYQRKKKTFETLNQLAKNNGGHVPPLSKFFNPTAFIPYKKNEISVNFFSMRKAIGQQVGGNILLFMMDSQGLSKSPDFILWSKLGVREKTKEIGMKRVKTGDPEFDKLFITQISKSNSSPASSIVPQNFYPNILKLKSKTHRLDVHKRGKYLRMEFQTLALDDQELSKELLTFFKSYCDFLSA